MAQKKAKAKAKAKVQSKPAVKAKATPKATVKPRTAAKPKVAAKAKAAVKPTKLKDFLIRLSKDPKHVDRFTADPAGTMKKAGVSKKDMDVLLTRDGNKIRQHLGDDFPPGCVILDL